MLKRFIRYLYEYEQGKRMRNVGFVKVDEEDEACTVHIHGKGLRLEGEKELSIYLFYENDGVCTGIFQGVIDNVNPAVNYRLRYTNEDVGVPENFRLIDGLIMQNNSNRKYAAVWDDMPVNVNDMRLWTEEEKPMPDLDEMEAACCEEEETTHDNSERKYTKIQRQELAQLPRCEWKLSNNSFLLHGYYNYRHLVLIEDGEDHWLGVPGIYHPREAKAAESFGFPQFIREKETDIILPDEEKNESDEFGYWCRHVKSVK